MIRVPFLLLFGLTKGTQQEKGQECTGEPFNPKPKFYNKNLRRISVLDSLGRFLCQETLVLRRFLEEVDEPGPS